MNRYDLHFHLLPGIDDGPATLGESLSLAADAASDGTATVVATPHVRDPYVTDVCDLPERVAELRAALRRERIALDVRIGGEVAHTMIGRLDQAELECVAQGPAGARWILLEAPFAGFGEEFHYAARELRARGFAVVIAHPERAAGVESDLTSVRREVTAGSALQLNVWSLAGRHGDGPRSAGFALVRAGLATVVASDAHADWRRPLISQGVKALLRAGVGDPMVRRLTGSGPRRLLECGVRTPVSALAA
jgi:protein-tyrosine phosphatase